MSAADASRSRAGGRCGGSCRCSSRSSRCGCCSGTTSTCSPSSPACCSRSRVTRVLYLPPVLLSGRFNPWRGLLLGLRMMFDVTVASLQVGVPRPEPAVEADELDHRRAAAHPLRPRDDPHRRGDLGGARHRRRRHRPRARAALPARARHAHRRPTSIAPTATCSAPRSASCSPSAPASRPQVRARRAARPRRAPSTRRAPRPGAGSSDRSSNGGAS